MRHIEKNVMSENIFFHESFGKRVVMGRMVRRTRRGGGRCRR